MPFFHFKNDNNILYKEFLSTTSMILHKQDDSKKLLDEKIMDIVLKKNVTYIQAKKMIESGQSSLSDFKFR